MAIPASAKAEPAYLALGDSVPFGFNPLALTTPPVFNPTIAANFVGYPEVLSKRLQVDVANASCPGETTMHFVSLTGLDDNCGLYRASLPLHVAYASSQLDYAVGFLLTHPNTGLVTVMVGADDLGAFARACGADEVCIQHDIATMSLPPGPRAPAAARRSWLGALAEGVVFQFRIWWWAVRNARHVTAWVFGEGIETQEEADTLKGLGLRYAQGYFFGRPQDPYARRPPQAAAPVRPPSLPAAEH